VIGVLMIAIAFPLAWFVREPGGLGEERRSGEPRRGGGRRFDPGVLRQPAFYLLALGSMASIGAWRHQPEPEALLRMDRGMAQGRAAWLLSLVLLGSIAGRLLMGWLADRWPASG